ncbi:MAG: ABC transporter substrate-binding protein [Dehalococcoidia bacterium]
MEHKDNYWLRSRTGRRRFLYGGGVAAVGSAAILAGCGDDDDEDSGSSPTSAATTAASGGNTATASATAAATTAAAAAGVKGGTLRLSKSEKDDGLDPAGRVVNQDWIQSKTYSWTHVYRTSDGKVLLDAAEKIETPDALTMIVTLNKGINFHDNVANGREMTADDLKFSIDRIPAIRKEKGGNSPEIVFDWIQSVEVVDKYTARIKQRIPFASRFIALGSRNPFAIVGKEVVEKEGGVIDNVTAGSGPYLLTKRDATGITLERNPKYFKRSAPNDGFPAEVFIDKIEERIIVDAAATKAAFLDGQTDFLNQGSVPVDRLSFPEYQKDSKFVAEKIKSFGQLLLFQDMLALTDPRVRQAIAMAINYDEFIATLFAGEGRYQGHVSGGFGPLALDPKEAKELHPFNPAEAKKLWEAAGKPFNNTIRMITPTVLKLLADSTDFIKGQLQKNLGVTVDVNASDIGTFVQGATKVGRKDWEIFVSFFPQVQFLPEYNALAGVMPTAFGSNTSNWKLDHPHPETKAAAEQAVKLYDAQAAALDPKEREQKMHELERFIMKGYWGGISLPVAENDFVIYNKRVQNVPFKDANLGLVARYQSLWLKA